jgi:histidine kinase
MCSKLFLSYLAVIFIGVIVLVLSSQFIVPAAFSRHMAGMGRMMGQGSGPHSGMAPFYVEFRASFNEALIYAALAATMVAVLLSVYLSRNVIAPVRAILQRHSGLPMDAMMNACRCRVKMSLPNLPCVSIKWLKN